ncbi:choline dehydrogenase [Streptomyces antioxidans]|uniref:Choline dehydrogenase n=1 Tax=Streptomyces antioxidans TaxID=1507734 RepID=A0A1V4D8H6_9ACTN|nr:GMC family oxidoreductase N-terminal domain-containing protein [Streptomyces antioxidans]OPF81604.1 choline dehydrogenase [Streptomyces antioxidans]
MPDHEVYDYVIVGAGSAGSVVTRRLIERTDATVLVLESGGPGHGEMVSNPSLWVENIGSEYDYGYAYEPHPATNNRVHALARGKLLGGSGGINALVWTRGHRADYDAWAAAGNTGWDYESLLPLFKRSEDWEDGATPLRGAGGPIRVERARNLHPVAQALIDSGRSIGMPYLDDITTAAPEGVGPVTLNIRDGRRVNPWDAYAERVLDSPRLRVLTGADVHRLTIVGDRCTGVEYVRDGLPATAGAREETVLCAGAIDTPRLLLRSGIGPSAELAAADIDTVVNSPGVGRNLQEHMILGGLAFEPYEPLGPLNNNLEGSVAFTRSRPDLDRPDLMIVAPQIPLVSPEIEEIYRPPPDSFCISPGLSAPRSRGYLRIHTGDRLEIQPHFLRERADLDALVDAVGLGAEIASRPAYRALIRRWVAPARPLSGSDAADFVRDAAMPYMHPAGTCALGSVVDPDLRLRGVDRVRVADASVMPTIVTSYIHATAVMIGEFAADRLAG